MVSMEEIRTAVMNRTSITYFYRQENFHNRIRKIHPHARMVESFMNHCKRYEDCFFEHDPPWELTPLPLGDAKLYSLEALKVMTDNFSETNLIKRTRYGRLFRGFIREDDTQVIVKTWDFLYPYSRPCAHHTSRFCDEVELLTDEKNKLHPCLMKLHGFCFQNVLAVLYDDKLTKLLSDELLSGISFRWDDRMKVAIQLADLFAWLHERRLAFGYVTPFNILIDEDYNIKVFDFDLLARVREEDNGVSIPYPLGYPDAPEIDCGTRTLKADVYIFGAILLHLIANGKAFGIEKHAPKRRILYELQDGLKSIGDESILQDDDELAQCIKILVAACLDTDPNARPDMKDIYADLYKFGMRSIVRKRATPRVRCSMSVERATPRVRCSMSGERATPIVRCSISDKELPEMGKGHLLISLFYRMMSVHRAS